MNRGQRLLDQVRAELAGKSPEERSAIKAARYHQLYSGGTQKATSLVPKDCCRQIEALDSGRIAERNRQDV